MLINKATWNASQQEVDNYLRTGHVNGTGSSPKAPLASPATLEAYFLDVFEQMSGGGSRTHLGDGTGGALLALLDRYPDQEAARSMAREILTRRGVRMPDGTKVALSLCSKDALRKFIDRKGVFAGRSE
jgi:hypothetical protein